MQYEFQTLIFVKQSTGHSHRVKITSLNRVKNQTLTVAYNFRGNVKRNKTLLVPSLEQLRAHQPDSGTKGKVQRKKSKKKTKC